MKRLARHSQPKTNTTLFDHIRELRMRLAVSALALLITGIGVYFIYGPLLALLRSPLNAPLYYSSPGGSFAFVMKICFMGALVVTIPILIYNLIMFVRPIFEEIVPLRRVYVTTAASSGLAIAGAAFGFIFIVPGSLHFFAGFQVSGLSALISADSYLNFVTNVIITFVLVFQLPLLVAFVDSIKPLPPKRMLGLEKWVVLASLIIALLVPFAFDFMTCLMIALPIVVLYNLSIVIVMAQHASFNRRVRAKARANQIVRPQQFTAAEASELTLSQLSFESLGDELTQLDRNEPLRAASPQRAGIDIRPLSTRPETVVSAAWVHHLADPIKLSAQARLISDVRRPSSIAL